MRSVLHDVPLLPHPASPLYITNRSSHPPPSDSPFQPRHQSQLLDALKPLWRACGLLGSPFPPCSVFPEVAEVGRMWGSRVLRGQEDVSVPEAAPYNCATLVGLGTHARMVSCREVNEVAL